MDGKMKDELSGIHSKLVVIERELAGYRVLMGNLHEDAMITGDDLIGPSQAFSKNSLKLQKLLHHLDLIIIKF